MLAEKLLESLESQTAVDAAIEEAERRWEAFKEGKIKGLALQDVFPNLPRIREGSRPCK
jgi:Putative addiction module component